MADNPTTRLPAEVFHPSVFLIEEMEERGWDRDRLATEMMGLSDKLDWGVTRVSLDFYFEVGPGEPGLRIVDVTAEAFARAFGTSKEFWINLEAAWLRGPAKGQPS